MNFALRLLIAAFVSSSFSTLFAQSVPAAAPDSVVVAGRIRNLTLRLYRETGSVTVARTNVLQPAQDFIRRADLQPDGSFRLTVPLLYPYEEMSFGFGNASTVFLAARGTVEITLDADSLYRTELPFQFGGTLSAQNNQLARYKAYEAKNRPKLDGARLAERTDGKSASDAFTVLTDEFSKTYRTWAGTNPLLPLVEAYLRSIARYEAATFLYEQYTAEGRTFARLMDTTLRPERDSLMTIARATASDRLLRYAAFRAEAVPVAGRSAGGLSAQTLVGLMLEQIPNLDEADRQRLIEIKARKPQSRDLPVLNRLYERNAERLAPRVTCEAVTARTADLFESDAVDFLKSRSTAENFATLSLDGVQALYAYAAPRIAAPIHRTSLAEVYGQRVKDSAAIRQVTRLLADDRAAASPVEVLPGVTVLKNADLSGQRLLDEIRKQGGGRFIYVLTYTTTNDLNQQVALQARQLATTFGARNLLVVYLCADGGEPDRWMEWVARNRPLGLNVFAVAEQASGLLLALRTFEFPSAALLGRDGKFIKRRAPLPDQVDELEKLLRKGR